MNWIVEPEKRTPVVADVDLLIAGRCISAEEEAMGQLRLIPVCSATGQAAGTAAALALKGGIFPRNVDVALLQKTLREQGMELDLSAKMAVGAC